MVRCFTFLLWFPWLAAAAVPPAKAVTFHPRLSGGDPISGRCQIRVWASEHAEISISGDLVTIRTASGTPARDAGSECTTAMPKQLSAFNFRGIEGPGELRLLKDAKENKGVAVISIKNPGARENHYAFQIVWFGVGGWGHGGYSPGRWRTPKMTAAMVRDCETAARRQIAVQMKINILSIKRLDGDRADGRENWIIGEAVGDFNGETQAVGIECTVDFSTAKITRVSVKKLAGTPEKTKSKSTPKRKWAPKKKWTPKKKETPKEST